MAMSPIPTPAQAPHCKCNRGGRHWATCQYWESPSTAEGARRAAEFDLQQAHLRAASTRAEARRVASAVVAEDPSKRKHTNRPLPLEHHDGWRPVAPPAEVLSPSAGYAVAPTWAFGLAVEVLGAVDDAREFGVASAEIAEALGVTEAAVRRVVPELVRRGWLQKDGRRLVRVYGQTVPTGERWGRLPHSWRPTLAAMPSGRSRSALAAAAVKLTSVAGGRTSVPFSARGLGRIYGVSHDTAAAWLRNLAAAGLVRIAGRRIVLLTGSNASSARQTGHRRAPNRTQEAEPESSVNKSTVGTETGRERVENISHYEVEVVSGLSRRLQQPTREAVA